MLVRQSSSYDSLLACISMAIECDYKILWSKDFIKKIERSQGLLENLDQFYIDKAFQTASLTKNKDYWCILTFAILDKNLLEMLLNGRRAILEVPSLNYMDSRHFVYWDGSEVQDPSLLQVYRWIEQLYPSRIWIFNEIRNDE